MTAPPDAGSRRFRAAMTLIVAVAFALRVLYVWMSSTEFPIRGDINQYVLYAWNLAHSGTFSSALPGSTAVVPDSYRGPGYPAFMAATMVATDSPELAIKDGPDGRAVLAFSSDAWMRLCIAVQVILGTATVWLAMALGRRWLPYWATLTAGVALAFWPHLVTFSAVLLSETLFAFCLLASVWMLCESMRRARMVWAVASGAFWGVTYLVNPLVALFPIVAAPLVAGRRGWRLALVFLFGFALAPALWSLRNFIDAVPGGALARVEENFVQGSWPQFLPAFNTRFRDEISRRIVDAVTDETKQLQESPAAGIAAIGSRMADDPFFYAHWYLLEKPYLLWDWSIRVGAGDIYFLPVEHSPFERIPLLSAIRGVFRALNPLLFFLSAAACAGMLLVRVRAGRPEFAPTLLALLGVYLTAIHIVLQAEPRYSIPYRPVEILLVLTSCAWIVEALRHRFGAAKAPQHE